MNSRKKSVTKFGILFLSILLIIGMIGTANAANKIIKVGVIAQLTGPYGPPTNGINEGVLDLLEAVNKYEPIPGITLKGVWVDGASSPAKAMSACKKMVSQHDPVIVVGWTTPSGLALKKYFIKKQIPQVQAGAADPMWEMPSWTFSAVAPYVNQVGGWVDFYVKHIWPKKGLNRKPNFAWVTWDNAAGRGSITDKAKAYIKSKGVNIMPGDGEFFPTAPTEVSAQILRLKKHEVDFTYGMLIFPTAAAILKGLNKQGMLDRIDLGMSTPDPPILIKIMKSMARNVYTSDYWTDTNKWAEKCPRVLEIYKANGREKLPKLLYGAGVGWGLVAAEAVRMAAKAAGPDLTGADCYKALTQMNNYKRWDVGVPVTFGETRRIGCDTTHIYRLNNNQMNDLGYIMHPNLTKFKF